MSVERELSAIATAKEMTFLDAAVEEFLTKAAQNYGVKRPIQAQGYEYDDLFRQFAMLLSWQPKTILFIVYKLLEILFGTQESLITAKQRPWKVFEVNPNEIIIEIPWLLIASGNDNASYLHGVSGDLGSSHPAFPLAQFFVAGRDLTKELPAQVNGLRLQIDNGNGVAWSEFTILSVTFAAGVTTITTTAAVAPGYVNATWNILIPGDKVASHRGDYMAPDYTYQADTLTTTKHEDRVYLGGDGKLEVFKFYFDLLVRAAGIVVRYEKVG